MRNIKSKILLYYTNINKISKIYLKIFIIIFQNLVNQDLIKR